MNAKEIEGFDKLIELANKYYNGKDTNCSDFDYDTLFNKISKEYESKFNEKFNIFNYVKFENDYIKVKHTVPYMSLSKTPMGKDFDFTKLPKGYVRTPKLDGSSIRAYYYEGELIRVLTRADDYYGVQQTEKLKNKVPNKVPNDVLCIDFEALTSSEDFGTDTCRAKANGLINSKYLQDEVDKYLCPIPWNVVTKEENEDYITKMNRVVGEGNYIVLKDEDLKNIFASTDSPVVEFKGKHYPIDGIVLYGENPFILKFYSLVKEETEVLKIEWNRSDYSYYIPKIVIKPVVLAKKNISKVAAGSVDTILSKGICKGTVVDVTLAGMTIPQIINIKSVPEVKDYTIDKCWDCGHELKYNSKGYYCPNTECKHYRAVAMNGMLGWIFTHNEQLIVKQLDPSNYDAFFQFLDTNQPFKEIFNNKIQEFIKGGILGTFMLDMFTISRLSKKTRNRIDSDVNSEKELNKANIMKCIKWNLTQGALDEYDMKESAVSYLWDFLEAYCKNNNINLYSK